MEKLATGIDGFDEISGGGLPKSRVTLIAGGAGGGKTLFMLSSIAGGVSAKGDPAVFLSFEERPDDIIENAASIGVDLKPLIENRTLRIEYIKRPTETVVEAGSYTLDGLLMRIELALKAIGAKTIAIDTIETLFGMFENERTVRQELVRVFNWLKSHGITTIVSGETGVGQLTRYGIEEYISDCVVFVDQRSIGDVTTRRLRIVKYRGTEHEVNEHPFLIDSGGLTIMPVSSAMLDHEAVPDHVTTGIDQLDDALCGGYRRGSTVLISGASGTGKTILAANFIAAACRRGEQCAVLSFEESPDEFLYNIGSAGVILEKAWASGRLTIRSVRPTLLGLERHLVEVYRLVEELQPTAVMVDPLSGLTAAGTPAEVYRTLIRFIDHLKKKQITTVFTMEEVVRLADNGTLGISSIIDTWLSVRQRHSAKRFRRELLVIKKRGTGHAHGYLPFVIGSDGLKIESKVNG